MSFIKLDEITRAEPVKGFHARFVHSEKMTFAYWDADSGSIVPEHSHPHEQICCVLEGKLELTVGSDTGVMEFGTIAVIPPNVSHKGRALTDCRIIDVFHPARDDYR